jgi:hypothetical protein
MPSRCDGCHTWFDQHANIMRRHQTAPNNSLASMLKRPAKPNRKVRAGLVALSFLIAMLLAVFPDELVQTALSQARRSRNTRTRRAAVVRRYSQFPHNVTAHKKVCTTCHTFPSDNWKNVRADAEAFPDVTDYPKHESCLGCHRQQFFRGRPPVVCSICHTNPSPRDSSRHPFPNHGRPSMRPRKGRPPNRISRSSFRTTSTLT